ncbi:MAG: phosphotransferase [Anaerolineae bacterium]
MDEPKLDEGQLRRRDPAAWTALLHHEPDLQDVVVTAVSAQPITTPASYRRRQQVIRYTLALAGHTDPVTFIGKTTNPAEANFYQHIAPQLPDLAPRCWYVHQRQGRGWIILNDVPNHFPPQTWSVQALEEVIGQMTGWHSAFWRQQKRLERDGFAHFIGERTYGWTELQTLESVYFEEGPAAVISNHAIYNAHNLAPRFLRAANGLAVMRSLHGWPGILAESHLTAVADLLDDPVPILEPLRELPVTLLHGDPHTYHWRLTLFGEQRLFDWQKAGIGPGVLDLVSFLEQFERLNNAEGGGIRVRPSWPATEETIIDSYLLGMSAELGKKFNARACRQAIMAARCLFVLLHWMPQFADWFADMPNVYAWQRLNRMSDEQLLGTMYEPMVGLRPYLANVFQRFLHAYRTL